MAQEKLFTVVTANGIKKFKSTANTVAELKADLRKNGISTENMAIQEGLTKIKFNSDSDYLPHDVPYKGTSTNNLVFRITQKEKHISSGAGTSREELYAKIKEFNLQDVVKVKYGKNFTQCKSSELVAAISESKSKSNINAITPKNKIKAGIKIKKADNKSVKQSENFKSCEDSVKDAITVLTSKIVDSGILTSEDGAAVLDLIGTELIKSEGYSQEEIDAMFKDM